MLPDVDADDGDVRQERVLVGGGGDLDLLGGRVQALRASQTQITPIGQQTKARRTSQPQPEPWMPAVVVLNCFLKSSKEPKTEVIASLSGPSLRTPPLPLPSEDEGARLVQKSEWLMWPAGGRWGDQRALSRIDDAHYAPPPLNLSAA